MDGEISELVFDAVNMDNDRLKSEDESYKTQMEPIVGTYPAKYSKDLINQLPSLNVGEAIVLGLMSKVPTLVKIDEFKGRRTGGDLDIVGDLANYNQTQEDEIRHQEQESLDLGYDY